MAKKTLKKDWSKINDKIKNRNNKTNDKDERIFVPTYNDKQTCKVTMRFLDTTDTDLPYVTVMQHFFSENMRWYVNHCPATIGKKCPVCDDLYKNKYFDKDKTIYDNRKKTTSFYTNVLIIDDVNNPTNNGKVFLFKFGVKIMDKIDDIIEEGKFPWDDNVGVNFIFTGKKNGKQTSYDASRFSDTETALEDYGDEDKILSLRHSLKSLIADDLFKEYDELKAKYNEVINMEDEKPAKKRSRIQDEDDDIVDITDDDDDDIKDIGDGDMISDSDDDDFFNDLEDDE